MNAPYESATHFKKSSVAHRTEAGTAQRIYAVAASLDGLGMNLLRLGLVIVLVWIGGLKFARYEAEGIVPLVANSPAMSFFYHHPAPEYRHYMNQSNEVLRLPMQPCFCSIGHRDYARSEHDGVLDD